mmetsp:Transcript_20248/g.58556  ORF Transcript_20248/g.58556 Transcript_20248/m.58556 type:complete len:228 (-) Transcript_20248:1313-1996(-)
MHDDGNISLPAGEFNKGGLRVGVAVFSLSSFIILKSVDLHGIRRSRRVRARFAPFPGLLASAPHASSRFAHVLPHLHELLALLHHLLEHLAAKSRKGGDNIFSLLIRRCTAIARTDERKPDKMSGQKEITHSRRRCHQKVIPPCRVGILQPDDESILIDLHLPKVRVAQLMLGKIPAVGHGRHSVVGEIEPTEMPTVQGYLGLVVEDRTLPEKAGETLLKRVHLQVI